MSAEISMSYFQQKLICEKVCVIDLNICGEGSKDGRFHSLGTDVPISSNLDKLFLTKLRLFSVSSYNCIHEYIVPRFIFFNRLRIIATVICVVNCRFFLTELLNLAWTLMLHQRQQLWELIQIVQSDVRSGVHRKSMQFVQLQFNIRSYVNPEVDKIFVVKI